MATPYHWAQFSQNALLIIHVQIVLTQEPHLIAKASIIIIIPFRFDLDL